jgi:hypothetical protein
MQTLTKHTQTRQNALMHTSLKRRWLALILAVAFAVPTAAMAQSTVQPVKADPNAKRVGESDDQAAYRLNEEGKNLVRLRKYEGALLKFRAALSLFPLSNAIFNVGSMLYTLKSFEESFAYLEQTLRAPLDPRQRQIVLTYRANVLKSLKHSHKDILIRTNPPGAKLSLNGKPLPFPAPTRVLVQIGTADITIAYPGFKEKHVVINSTSQTPPKGISVRLVREEPFSKANVRCPPGSDIFIDGQMRGFELVRTKLLAGPHTVRCGMTQANAAFERNVTVRKSIANTFDFGQHTE